MSKGLGQFPSVDMRDSQHLMAHHLEELGAIPSSKTWAVGEVVEASWTWTIGDTLDQGFEGSCVGHGWTDWENCRPRGHAVQQDHAYAVAWYERAKELDEWWGTNYDGTSVRAGAKVAQERGFLSEYVWASSLADIDAWLLSRGPIVIGSKWFYSMDYPDLGGFISVDTSSGYRGGHCYLLYGKGEQGNYKLQNSWGYEYGKEGTFRLTPENFSRLIGAGSFVACAAIQTGEA